MVKRINSNASKRNAKVAANFHGGYLAASKSGERRGDVTVVKVPKDGQAVTRSQNWSTR